MEGFIFKSPPIVEMYLTRITTKNIQNHREVVIDLPPTGLIVFTGNNSNGKSVIVKATKTLISGKLSRPIKRASLVNKQMQFGEIIYERNDGLRLTAHIAREANLTYVKLEAPDAEPIVRYLADKSYLDLVHKFGWHYDEKTGVSLNIAEADDPLLFYKTPYSSNGSILHSATSDSRADKAIVNFDTTIKEARKLRDSFSGQLSTISSALSDLKIEDVIPLQEKKLKLERCMRCLETVYIPNIPSIQAVPNVKCVRIYRPTIPEIKEVPNVKYVNVHRPVIPEIKYPRIIGLSCNIPNILPVAKELKALQEHRCPTCGRGFDCAC